MGIGGEGKYPSYREKSGEYPGYREKREQRDTERYRERSH
jgi:hypothetical protein